VDAVWWVRPVSSRTRHSDARRRRLQRLDEGNGVAALARVAVEPRMPSPRSATSDDSMRRPDAPLGDRQVLARGLVALEDRVQSALAEAGLWRAQQARRVLVDAVDDVQRVAVARRPRWRQASRTRSIAVPVSLRS